MPKLHTVTQGHTKINKMCSIHEYIAYLNRYITLPESGKEAFRSSDIDDINGKDSCQEVFVRSFSISAEVPCDMIESYAG